MRKIELKVEDNLKLKSGSIFDAEILFKLTNQNRGILQPWLPWVPKVQKVTDSLSFIREAIKEMKSGKGFGLGIWCNNQLVGCIGLHGLDLKTDRRASFGYWLAKDAQGNGIMTKCVKTLADYAFTKLQLNRLGIEAAVENKVSIQVAQRLNFHKEGELRKFAYVDGRFLTYAVFSLLKSDYEK